MSQSLTYGFHGDRAYAQYYKHTGKVTLLGIVAGVACGIAAAPLLAWVYAYADSYIPIVYLNMALVVGFGAGIALAVAGPMRWGKVRNAPLTLALTMLLTAVAYYLCWAAWICVTFDRYAKGGRNFGFVELLLAPRGMYELAAILDESGTFSLGHGSSANSNVTGIPLMIIWAIEGVAIFATAFLVAKSLGADNPFCERCEKWSAAPTMLAPLAIGDVAEMRRALEAHEWPALQTAAAAPIDERHFWSLMLGTCGSCDELNLLTLNDVKITLDKNGKAQIATKALVRNLRVSDADVAAIRAAVAPPVAVAAEVPDVASDEDRIDAPADA